MNYFSNEFFRVHVPHQTCIKFQSNENHIYCIDISFFKTLTTTIKHSGFSHTLIMMAIIAFITSQHYVETLFWWVFSCRSNFWISPWEESQVKLQCLQWYVIYFSISSDFFSSDSVNVFVLLDALVLQELNFSFSIIFLNILYLVYLWYIPA